MSKWLSPDEAAAELGVSRTTILRAIDDRRLTSYRFGKHREGKTDRRGLSISREALETFKTASRVKGRHPQHRLVEAPRPDLMSLARDLALEDMRGRR